MAKKKASKTKAPARSTTKGPAKSKKKEKAPARSTTKGPAKSKKKKKAPARSKEASAASRKLAGRDLDAVYRRVRELLTPYEAKLAVTADSATGCTLEGTKPAYKGKPMFFAGARRGRAYVSFHLFPVYVHPGLLTGMSAGLRKRMQGKSCFNFTTIDEALLEELAELTAKGHARFEADGVL